MKGRHTRYAPRGKEGLCANLRAFGHVEIWKEWSVVTGPNKSSYLGESFNAIQTYA